MPAEPPTDRDGSRLGLALAFALPLLVVLPLLVGAAWTGRGALLGLFCWFDPILLIYNALLVGVAMCVPTFVVLAYVRGMAGEKQRRLQHDLGAEWPQHQATIEARTAGQSRFAGYLGGVIATTALTGFGATILLLVKPVPITGTPADACAGLDFGRGASFLLLGWFSQYVGKPADYYPTLMLALTAFQFGFLGAWVYFLSSLTRDYFACDLTPASLINGAVRMVTASLVALVAAFGLPLILEMPPPPPAPVGDNVLIRLMPVIAFFLGYFPARALLLIERLVGRTLGDWVSGAATSPAMPLSVLAGVSYLHEVRLGQEGIDNVANLAEADPLDLALRTGFRLPQLRRWVDEAWLASHLGEEYVAFLHASGVGGRRDLATLIDAARQDGKDPVAMLVACIDDAAGAARLKPRLEVVCAIAETP
jgi:hypothetical protein